MKIQSITSESNNTLKTIRALHRRQAREKERLFLLEGEHCLLEALKHKLDLQAIVVSNDYLLNSGEELNKLDLEQISAVDARIFGTLVTTVSNCGVIAIARLPEKAGLRAPEDWQPRVFAIADAIQDPGNLGTLIRTAYAAELGGLIILKGSVDAYNPKVVRAAAGALFALPLRVDMEAKDAVDLCHALNIRLVVCQASATKRYFEADLSDRAAIVLGNEGQGINDYLRASADESISIPMNPASESLNVAISGGIILFETLKQRLSVANR